MIMTDNLGRPSADDKNSTSVGPDGPVVLQDTHLVNKLAHFDRERIPERVVHAKGTGAFGYFECYQCMSEYTCAHFLQSPGKKTKTFVRFSTVIGSKGSADTVRDPRGFAVKFYTEQGNYDIVGNDIPVFFIRDAMQFPDVIHALKPAPDTNLRNPERFWDFISLTPESTHMIAWLYSDRGTIKDYARIDGFGVNTYIWVNKSGKRRYVKYHFKTNQGLETISRQEADYLAGADPDIAVRTLRERIDSGNYPSYELCVQLMDPKDVEGLSFDPLDDTKTWPEDQFPLYRIGKLVLNKNPDNFFAQVEQSAFCPGNIVPGVEFSADKMLQGRIFSYTDTQRHRIGPNFAQLPVNKPIVPVHNNERDGFMTYHINPEPINYSPNSLNNNKPTPTNQMVSPVYVKGYIAPSPILKKDDYSQAGERYLSYSKEERLTLADNIAVELVLCNSQIIKRVLSNFAKACPEWATLVENAIAAIKANSMRPKPKAR